MRVSILSLVAAASVVTAQSYLAPIVKDNFPGASYAAHFDKDKSALTGSVSASSLTGTTGVKWTINVGNLPEAGGPFMYHIHEKPVPADGNCTGTGAHLDPYKRGEVPKCDHGEPDSCQVGDLSGKYGEIADGIRSFQTEYNDQYTSTGQNNPAFFGNLSVVFHFANKTRFACANFISGGEEPEKSSSACETSTAISTASMATGFSSGHAVPTVSSGYAAPTASGGHTHYTGVPPNPPSPTAPGVPEFTNAASKFISGTGAVVGFAAALFL